MIVFFWLLIGLICAVIGAKKGEGCGAFVLGVLLGPLAIPFVLLSRGHRKRCAACKELIHEDATVCSHCREPQPKV